MHLKGTDRPLFHYVPASRFHFDQVEAAARDLGYNYFVVDGDNVDSEAALMGAFATSMNFPLYFGANWNALLDLTRDLSWTKAEGHVLIIANANALPSLPHELFSTLVDVLEATTRDWRDERGEYGERPGPVPFHTIFSGSDGLRESLRSALMEPLCKHNEDDRVEILAVPTRLQNTAAYHDAEQLLRSGADPELLMMFLRDKGMDERDSIYAIAALLEKTIPEARSLIDNSRAWAEFLHRREEQFRQVARDFLRESGEQDN